MAEAPCVRLPVDRMVERNVNGSEDGRSSELDLSDARDLDSADEGSLQEARRTRFCAVNVEARAHGEVVVALKKIDNLSSPSRSFSTLTNRKGPPHGCDR